MVVISSAKARPATGRRRIVVGLMILGAAPVIIGVAAILSTFPGVNAGNIRFVRQPVPIVLHVLAAPTYLVLGALQFLPGLRRSRWHRTVGRILVPAGLATALSGMYMKLFYPHVPADWPLPGVVQLAVGMAWSSFLVLGFVAARRHDYARHGHWMLRAYALGMGTGTQILLVIPYTAISGRDSNGTGGDLVFISAWVINLIIAELIIRRQPAVRLDS